MIRMLINATQQEELRVALVDGQRLYDLDIESGSREQKKANIYKGKITRIEPSLEAAFVDYGAERHGFLPLKEISKTYFSKKSNSDGRINIKDVLTEGQEVIVQVDKEERGNKGAALTTFVSLAGRYLVLMPNNPRAGGISRRIDGDDRTQLKEAMSGLEVPDNGGLIVRTAGVGRSTEELQWDLDYLQTLWDSITKAAADRPAPFLIYQESNIVIRAIRDYLRDDIGEVLIDEKSVYQDALNFVMQVMPHFKSRIKLYTEPTPLFNRFQIETQIETAFQREVRLPSGGSIVIDPTEALVSIDINSARATKGGDIEETALQTNLEAADEIARQLRLRDIGGLVVIDFIDMTPVRNQKEVENRMKAALEADRARVQIGRISRFGLLEMSRQRLRPSLGETSGIVCPRCNGQGFIRDVESLALSVLRLIEEECAKERTAQIRAILPVSVATFLLNEKRTNIAKIEKRNHVHIILVPNPHMETPHFHVERIRDDNEVIAQDDSSYNLVEEPVQPPYEPRQAGESARQQAAVTSIAPAQPAPAPVAPEAKVTAKKPGFFKRLFNALFGSAEETVEQEVAPKKEEQKPAAKAASEERKPQRNRQQRERRPARQQDKDSKPRQDGEQKPKSTRQSRRAQAQAQTQDTNANAKESNNRNKQREQSNKDEQQTQTKEPTNKVKARRPEPEVSERKRDRNDNKRRNGKLKDEIEQAQQQAQAEAEVEAKAAAEQAENSNNAAQDNSEANSGERKPRRSRRSRRNNNKSEETAAAANTEEANTEDKSASKPQKSEATEVATAQTDEQPTKAKAAKSDTSAQAEDQADKAEAKGEKGEKGDKPSKPKMSVKAGMNKVEQSEQADTQVAEPAEPATAAKEEIADTPAIAPAASDTEQSSDTEAAKTDTTEAVETVNTDTTETVEAAKTDAAEAETAKDIESESANQQESSTALEATETEAPASAEEESPAASLESPAASLESTESEAVTEETSTTAEPAPQSAKPEVESEQNSDNTSGRKIRQPRPIRGRKAAKPASEEKAPVELPKALIEQQEKAKQELLEKREQAAQERRQRRSGRVKNDPRLSSEANSATDSTPETESVSE
ncbi:Ribonuclease E [Marinomonas aquimarina]|uniref:Ribonuclease E n=1 Tax=Marinomonas aquimarina TaxID=295068 RepID=A0A1A8TI55_9GAMM|nr:ribonuclease E [Marinomonas aquimarina]SBS31811.1 Ribonuclease E [Marinomonas aquimarina]